MSDCGIQNDQAISSYYSELNHLTQELQQSNDLDVALDKIGLNENSYLDTIKPFYGNEDFHAETEGDDEESSPFYNNRVEENINHISQFVSDVHSETVLLSHEMNGQQSDASTDELDGDRLNAGDFSSLNMLHSVNLKSM